MLQELFSGNGSLYKILHHWMYYSKSSIKKGKDFFFSVLTVSGKKCYIVIALKKKSFESVFLAMEDFGKY